MRYSYRVWAQIVATATLEEIDEPVPIGAFDTLKEARAFLVSRSEDGYDSQGKDLPDA